MSASSLEIEKLLKRHGPGAVRVKLAVLAVDGTHVPCDSWVGPLDTPEKLTEVFEEIEERAQRQADLLGGTHAFWVEVEGDKDTILGTEIFRIAAEAMPGRGASIATEPANEAGLIAQLMRHNEINYRASLQNTERIMRMQAEMLDSSHKRIGNLEQRVADNFEVVHQAVMGTREHELNLLKESTKAEMKGAFAKQIQNLLPEVASAVASKGKGPDAQMLSIIISVKGLMGSLTPEQIEKIFGALTPEQQVAMAGMLKRMAEAEDKKGPAGAANPQTH